MLQVEFFVIGMLFIILFFCLLLYFNKVIDKEYVFFGIFIVWYMAFYWIDSIISDSNLPFVVLMLFPIFLVFFLFNVIRVRIPVFVNYLNIATLLLCIIQLFWKDIDLRILKLLWKAILCIQIIATFVYCYKIYKSENMPELINALVGLFLLFCLTVGFILHILSLNVFKYGILFFIMIIINGLTRRFARINNELKKFSLMLIKERDAERKRLGKELHDGLGQLLIAIKLNLQMFSEKNKNSFQNIIDEISIAIKELKNICENLKPAMLDKMGLIYAMEYSLDKYGKNFHINFERNINNDEEISSIVKENIFRIFQECLTNAIKYSNATHLNILLKKVKNFVIFNFKDNGVGFEETSYQKGLGLMSIRERVDFLNGEINIVSKPGYGVEIYIKVPLE